MTAAQSKGAEARTELRKILRCVAKVAMGDSVMSGKTIDMSSRGICIMLPEQMRLDVKVGISLNLLVGANVVTLKVIAKAIYSTCVGTSGFRTGFQFLQIDPQAAKTIAQIMT